MAALTVPSATASRASSASAGWVSRDRKCWDERQQDFRIRVPTKALRYADPHAGRSFLRRCVRGPGQQRSADDGDQDCPKIGHKSVSPVPLEAELVPQIWVQIGCQNTNFRLS